METSSVTSGKKTSFLSEAIKTIALIAVFFSSFIVMGMADLIARGLESMGLAFHQAIAVFLFCLISGLGGCLLSMYVYLHKYL
jgi:hypothetical protein